MKKLDIVKAVTTFIVGAGTTQIVNGIVTSNTAPEKVTDKVAVKGASVVIGMMAADATKSYTDEKIDEVAAWYNENFNQKS